jgi:Flp pilus assembly protein TadB/Mg-chelatase subunit ChlD
MTPQRWLVWALVLASFALLPGPRAHAATTDPASITDLAVRQDTVTFTVSVAVPPGTALLPQRTQVLVAGRLVEAHVTAAATSSGQARVAVLVVDTSGSMGPGGIAAARDAANGYLSRVAADVKVGLVSFADRPHVVTAPTTDRTALRSGLAQLRSKGETSLYDAVQTAVQLAGPGGAVVVLSDGADTVSRAALGDALVRVQASKARVSTVAFRTQDGVRGPLTQIARAGGGRVVAASGASDLAAAFADAAAALPAQLSVSAFLPDNLPGGQTLEVRVATARSIWAATATLPAGTVVLPGVAPTADLPLPAAALVTTPWYASLGVVLGVVFVALLLIALLLAPRAQSAAQRRRRALAAYSVGHGRPHHLTVSSPDAGATIGLVELSQRFVDKRGTAASITRKLEQAGSRLRPGEWIVLRFCTVLAVAAVVSVITQNALIGVVCGIVLGWAGSYVWLRRKQARRSRAFADALPDTLQLVASSLRTGFSLPQALDAAQQDGVEPMTSELGRALAANRIGAPLEDELELIADRTRSDDWRWAVMAVRIQRTVGGNLSEVLLTTVRTLRERAATRRLVRSLSAEGRLSAYILLGLPVFVATVLFLFRREYVRPLWTTTPGIVMVVVAVLLMAVGTLWMRSVIKVEA